MESTAETEDIIPPTPDIQLNKVCSRIDKTSVTSSKLSRKVSKSDLNGFKRKRIISPDCKKVKQKVRQVTLYNFLVKTNKNVDSNSIGCTSHNTVSPVKVNLLNKFEETELKNAKFSGMNSRTLICSSKEQVSSVTNESLKNMCKEVASLELGSEIKTSSALTENKRLNETTVCSGFTPESSLVNKCISIGELPKGNETNCLVTDDKVSIETLNYSSCKLKNDVEGNYRHTEEMPKESNQTSTQQNGIPCIFTNDNENLKKALHTSSSKLVDDEEMDTMHSEELPKDMDETFSWMKDVTFDKENLDLAFSSDDHAACAKCSDKPEEDNCIKFRIKSIQRDPVNNEMKLTLSPKNDSNVVKTCYLKGFWLCCSRKWGMHSVKQQKNLCRCLANKLTCPQKFALRCTKDFSLSPDGKECLKRKQTDTVVSIGDIVHILNPSKFGKTVIDNDTGFFVVNPDFLISSTAVVSTLFCMRKAVLNHILPQWSPGNNIMMIGSLVHDVFQKSVNNHVNTTAEIISIVKTILKKRENLVALCCQDMPVEEVERKICKYIPNILNWINKHCSFQGKSTFTDISVTNVEDIEENVWCPKYGIKGKIDLTVNAHYRNKAASKIMPLELKTGRHTFSAEHIGQVNLYSLMMEERSKEASDGLLLYLRDKDEMKVINTNHNSKRGLIQLRNELASYVYKWVSSKESLYEEIEQCHLPPPINNKRNCEKCPYLLPCTVYQKTFSKENLLDSSHAMSSLIPASTNHLSDSHIKYFLHWSRLLLLENTTTAEVKAFWTEDSVSREKQGMCLSHISLDVKASVRQDKDGGSFIHTFVRLSDNPFSQDFKNCCLKEGDYVAVSNQKNPDEVAIAMGYIITVREESIELAIDRNLSRLARLKGVVFRIDKIVSNSAAACVRNNLMLLMQDEDQPTKLRKLIIDKQLPKFLQSLPKQIVLQGRPVLKCLNKNQQKAVLKALMAEDYFLIKGMPGTGKTSTIVALVQLLVKMNISVLLTSYTHSAIDNILLKLKEHLDFVRLGPAYRIHPQILEYSFENLTQGFSSPDQYSTFMKEKLVIATTSLGMNHPIFKLRQFDVCIVDEASQINQIACLGPLFFAKKFILVGDDKQLPPLVLNNEAREKGMQESLFQRLQSSTSCIALTLQYRMNREIMRICNELTYSGAMQCGSEAIANAVLHLDQKSESIHESFPHWVSSVLDTDISKSVCFLNTDSCKTSESEKSKHDIEADMVILLIQVLTRYKVPHSEIGIIAPYRKQVDLIEAKLKNLTFCEIEVNTVDQYQGRDKDVIIISCARPNDSLSRPDKVGIILDDERRLNVAVSRARKKLVFIGSKVILLSYKPFERLINCLQKDQFLDIT